MSDKTYEFGGYEFTFQPGPMDPDVKEQWLKALRSGEYTQGQHQLVEYRWEPATDEPIVKGHCCLGVLQDITCGIKKEEWDNAFPPQDQCNKWFNTAVEEVTCYSPFSSMQGLFATMNDGEGKTFEEIADWIETYL